MTEQEIISKVRNIMNEAGEDTALTLLSEDTVKLDEYIKSSISDAVNLVINNSPVRCVNRKSCDTAKITANADGGTISLPNDFISLIALKLSTWKRIVSHAYPVNSEEYKVQTNEYTMAGIYKPMCFLSYNESGKCLEYFSKNSGAQATISFFQYEAQYDSTDGLNLDKTDVLAQAVCYMCASLVYSIFENSQTAKEMQAIAVNLIPKE